MDTLESHLSVLATVGSTALFIGLFGTVWGVMNSFQGIAVSNSTNLAAVAPVYLKPCLPPPLAWLLQFLLLWLITRYPMT